MNEQTPKLNAALSAAQSEMPAVAFDAQNPFLKNRFASLGAVIAASKPVLAKHGLSVEQMPVSESGQIGVRTTLRHSSGESASGTIFLPLGEERGKSLAQVAGSIITYLRRYSWSSVLGMYADEDTDGHGATEGKRATAPAQAPASAVPPPSGEFSVVATVKDVVEKTGVSKGKPWLVWFVKFEDGTEAGTFSRTIAETAISLVNARASVKVKPGKREGALEIISIEPIDIIP